MVFDFHMQGEVRIERGSRGSHLVSHDHTPRCDRDTSNDCFRSATKKSSVKSTHPTAGRRFKHILAKVPEIPPHQRIYRLSQPTKKRNTSTKQAVPGRSRSKLRDLTHCCCFFIHPHLGMPRRTIWFHFIWFAFWGVHTLKGGKMFQSCGTLKTNRCCRS